jgi:hypothetical protein
MAQIEMLSLVYYVFWQPQLTNWLYSEVYIVMVMWEFENANKWIGAIKWHFTPASILSALQTGNNMLLAQCTVTQSPITNVSNINKNIASTKINIIQYISDRGQSVDMNIYLSTTQPLDILCLLKSIFSNWTLKSLLFWKFETEI